MTHRWMLSQTFIDPTLNVETPVAASYGGQWHVPLHPATQGGWCLVQIFINQAQLNAATQDSRVLVLPLLYDPSPLPQRVIDTYASMGATVGMSLGALLAKLAESEPTFCHSIS